MADHSLAAAGSPVGAIVRRHHPQAPLTPAQEGLSSFYQLAGRETAARMLNMAALFHITGPFDLGMLEEAAGLVIARHEALRTRYEVAAEPHVQVVLPPWEPRVRLHDAGEGEVNRVLTEAAAAPFDLEEGRPVRLDAVRLGDEHHALAVTIEHLACDPSSYTMFITEMLALYRGLREDRVPPVLPELPIQYGDFAHWQRARSDAAARDGRELSYWSRKLAGFTPLPLPFGLERTAPWELTGRTRWFDLDEADRAGLAALGASGGATLFAAVLGAVGRALGQACDDDDVTVVSFVSHRPRPECRKLIGLFGNMALLRMRGLREASWPAVVGVAREAIFGALAHHNLTFGEVLRIPGVAQILDRSRSFWAAIHFYRSNEYLLTQAADVTNVARSQEFSMTTMPDLDEGSDDRTILPFDIHLSVWDRDDHLVGLLRYNSSLLDDAAADRLLATIRTSLRAAAAAGRA